VWRDFADAPPSVDPLAETLREGKSGCAPMDAFARELVGTGYMHNHARMWWASFWTHRAGLPWREGARFFLDHLLDADAASNTLSWRWVAGLQTAGKTYLVRRSNLETYWPDAPTEGLDQLEGEPRIRIPPDSADRSRRVIEDLPESPGVYLWKDAEGKVLYVGKAKRLRSRVKSYWAQDHLSSPKTRGLMRKVRELDTIVVPSESHALILEATLIKEYHPRFNIALRDDKSYPYIKVTVQEPFPRVIVTRRLQDDGARYFGPYTDVGSMRRALNVVKRIFTVRSCHYNLPREAPERPPSTTETTWRPSALAEVIRLKPERRV
jgi:hypothetical protein